MRARSPPAAPARRGRAGRTAVRSQRHYFEQRLLGARKLVEPADHRFDRRWDGKRSRGRVGGDRGRGLLEEERVPLGDRDDLRPRALRRSTPASRASASVSTSGPARASRFPAVPAAIEELGPPEPDPGRPAPLRHERGEVVDEVVEGRLAQRQLSTTSTTGRSRAFRTRRNSGLPEKIFVRRERRRERPPAASSLSASSCSLSSPASARVTASGPAGIPQDLDERPVPWSPP